MLKSTIGQIKDGCIGCGIPGTLLGKPLWGVLILPPLRGPVGKAQGHPSAREG